MNLDPDNLNHWGLTPEEDAAERQQRALDIAKESAELDKLGLFEPESYSLTGQEFLDTHESTDDHPRSMAFGQFLRWTDDANIAQDLAFRNKSALDRIGDPGTKRVCRNIYARLEQISYWEQFDAT